MLLVICRTPWNWRARPILSDNAGDVAEALFGGWTQSAPKAAAEAAAQLPEGDLRTAALWQVAQEWADASPAEAFEWAVTLPMNPEELGHPGLGSYQNNAQNGALQAWVSQDAGAVVDRLQQLPDGPLKTTLIYAACGFDVEAKHDPASATDFLMLLPEGKERDKAFAECAERIANHDPETALAWVWDNRKSEWSG